MVLVWLNQVSQEFQLLRNDKLSWLGRLKAGVPKLKNDAIWWDYTSIRTNFKENKINKNIYYIT